MPNPVQDQIDAMLAIGDGSEEPVEEPIVDPPVEDPIEDPPVEDPPVEDPPVEDLAPDDPPIDEDPPVDPPVDDEMVTLREENEKLRKQVEERHVKEPAPTPEPTPDPEPAPIEEIDFVGDVDLDDISRDPVAFNTLLNKIHAAGVTSARGIQETTLRAIPDIVKSNVTIQSTLKKEVETFYADNEDLKPFKKVVAAVYEELASDNPDWTIANTFKEVEKETRNRLELHKKATDADPDPDPKPRTKGPKFANTKGPRQRTKPRTDALLSQIDEMNQHAQL